MGQPTGLCPARFIMLVAVFALHFGLFTVLLVASRIRARVRLTEDVVTTLVFPPAFAAARRVEPAHLTMRPALAPALPLSNAPTIEPLPDVAPPVIDWAAEAQKSAAALASQAPADTHGKPGARGSSVPRPLFGSPAHHAGEQYKTESGDSIVWISDQCYLISSLPVLGAPDVLSRLRGTMVACPGEGGTARGDLFESLPAYKKYGPK